MNKNLAKFGAKLLFQLFYKLFYKLFLSFIGIYYFPPLFAKIWGKIIIPIIL
jgi:hypothetical protein